MRAKKLLHASSYCRILLRWSLPSTTRQYLRDVRVSDIIGRSNISLNSGENPNITGKTVLVTGAAGSIGSELCKQLVAASPCKIIALDTNESGLYDLQMALRGKVGEVEIVPIICDVTDKFALESCFKQMATHVVFHVAAYKHVPLLEDVPYQAMRVNVGGTAAYGSAGTGI